MDSFRWFFDLSTQIGMVMILVSAVIYRHQVLAWTREEPREKRLRQYGVIVVLVSAQICLVFPRPFNTVRETLNEASPSFSWTMEVDGEITQKKLTLDLDL